MFSRSSTSTSTTFSLPVTLILAAGVCIPLVWGASGYDNALNNLEDGAEPLVSLAKLVPRIGRRSIDDDIAYFKAAKSLPRIGKRVNNNEIFPGARRLMKPLPRVGRSSQIGTDNFLLNGLTTTDVFKSIETPLEPPLFKRASPEDAKFLTGFKSLPRIGRRDASESPADSSQENAEVRDSQDTRNGEKRVTRALTQMGSWSNSDLPWFRQQDGPGFPSKKSALAELVRMSALPWDDAVERDKPIGSPLTVVTLEGDREGPETWHYGVLTDGEQRIN